MALKPRHRKFVAAFLVHQNQTKAAEEAGYAKSGAYQEGHRLLKNAEIKAEVEKGLLKLEAAQLKRAEKHGITKEWWLQELKQLADADIDQFIHIEKFLRYTGKSGKKYFGTRATAIATKLRKAGLGKLIKKISETKSGISIELHSKQFAHELIGKHFGWAKDHVHHSGGTADRVAIVDEEALARALKKVEDEY